MSSIIDSTNIGNVLQGIFTKIKSAFWQKSEITELPIDASPTANSNNLVKSGGIYTALSSKADNSSVHSIPSGGTQGQVLKKSSSTDYAVEWGSESGGTVTDVTVGGTSVVNGNGVAIVPAIPSVPVQDVTVGGTSVLNNGTAVVPAIPAAGIPSGGSSGQVLAKSSATDYAVGWVTPSSGGVTDVQVGGTSVVSSGVANIQTESVSSVDLETPVETTYPTGGFRPNVVYDLGSQTGSKTYALYTTGLDSTIKNEWVWSFTTGSTAPNITWPSPTGMKWDGGSAPTINSNCLYEISIRLIGSYYVGYYKEIEL